MAYGIKYKFRFEGTHDTYEVQLLENGYYGNATKRPLGAAPVIHMQESDPFRATSLDLTLECQTDGEYVDLYTSDPRQYKVEVRKVNNNTLSLIWTGFVATELYSEPDIAPPYDVHITAIDGLGILKEYDFQTGFGGRPVRTQLQSLLAKTGLTLDLYSVTQLCKYGEWPADFMDDVKIDMDYMDGKNCYDVLSELLTTLRCVVTQWNGAWVIIRETDAQILSNGDVNGIKSDKTGVNDTIAASIEDMTAKIGQMGAVGTDMWPIGYLTRRVVPAKKRVVVSSAFHAKNGAPALSTWTGRGYTSYNSTTGTWSVGYNLNDDPGTIEASMNMFSFKSDIKVKIKASCTNQTYYVPSANVKVLAIWVENGTNYYFQTQNGWVTNGDPTGAENILQRDTSANPDLAPSIEVVIPAHGSANSGHITIKIEGYAATIFDVAVELLAPSYKDVLLLANGARGAAEDLEVSGWRQLSSLMIPAAFCAGMFFKDDGDATSEILTAFSDGNNSNKDFMSLSALAYAKQHAAPRIEITGNLDFPGSMYCHPLFLKSHNQWALVSSFDWNLKEAEFNFKAVTLPTATLTVDSETITSIPND